MRIHNPYTSQPTTPSSSPSTSNSSSVTGQSPFAQALASLNNFVTGTPADQMRAEVLAQCGYTEAQLQAMTPADRAAAEKKIAERMKELTQEEVQQRQAKSNAAANLTI